MATSRQAKKLIEVFEDVKTDPMQEILGDGLLAIIRDRRDLAQQFINVARGLAEIRPINHTIDLAVPCKLPFKGAERISPAKSGVVKIERRGGNLYIDGKKIELFHSAGQQGDSHIVGHELRKEFEAKGGQCGGSILDHLVAHPELWPESWKRDENGDTIFVYFWDDIFRGSDGGLCVRYGYWSAGRVVSYHDWLDYVWYRFRPSASVVS